MPEMVTKRSKITRVLRMTKTTKTTRTTTTIIKTRTVTKTASTTPKTAQETAESTSQARAQTTVPNDDHGKADDKDEDNDQDENQALSDRNDHHSGIARSTMAQFHDLPAELVILIAQSFTSNDVNHLSSLTQACRCIRVCTLGIFYEKANELHPYLLYWATTFDKIDVMTGALDAGANPNQPYVNANYCYGWQTWPDVYDPIKVFDDWIRENPSIEDNEDEPGHRQFIVNQFAKDEDLNILFRSFLHSDEVDKAQRDLLSRRSNRLRGARRFGFTFPIHMAVKSENSSAFDLLVKHGARLDLPGKGLCPCHVGIFSARDGVDCPGLFTPLHLAVNAVRYERNMRGLGRGNRHGYDAADSVRHEMEEWPIKILNAPRHKGESYHEKAKTAEGESTLVNLIYSDLPKSAKVLLEKGFANVHDVGRQGTALAVARHMWLTFEEKKMPVRENFWSEWSELLMEYGARWEDKE